jgi:hypothetical protein
MHLKQHAKPCTAKDMQVAQSSFLETVKQAKSIYKCRLPQDTHTHPQTQPSSCCSNKSDVIRIDSGHNSTAVAYSTRQQEKADSCAIKRVRDITHT